MITPKEEILKYHKDNPTMGYLSLNHIFNVAIINLLDLIKVKEFISITEVYNEFFNKDNSKIYKFIINNYSFEIKCYDENNNLIYEEIPHGEYTNYYYNKENILINKETSNYFNEKYLGI